MNGRMNPGGQGQGSQQRPIFDWRLIFWPLLLFFLLFPFFSKQCSQQGVQLSYSAFLDQVQTGNVEQIKVQGEKITGELKKSVERKNLQGEETVYKEFFTYVPSFGDNKLLPMLETAKVKIVTEPTKGVSWWSEILIGLLPFLILIGLGVFFLGRRGFQAGQGIFSFAQSRARLYERRKEGTTFKDVAGAYGAKIELQEIID